MWSWFVRGWIYLVNWRKKMCRVDKQFHENEKYWQEMEENGSNKGQTDRKTHSVGTNGSFENIWPPFSYCRKSVCESSLVLDLTVGLWPLSLSAQGRCFCYIIAWGQHLPSRLVKPLKAGEPAWTQEALALLMYNKDGFVHFWMCYYRKKLKLRKTYSTIQHLIIKIYILQLIFSP